MILNPVVVQSGGGEAVKCTRISGDSVSITQNASGKQEVHLAISGVKKLLAIDFVLFDTSNNIFWYGDGATDDISVSLSTIGFICTPTTQPGATGCPITITDNEVYFEPSSFEIITGAQLPTGYSPIKNAVLIYI